MPVLLQRILVLMSQRFHYHLAARYWVTLGKCLVLCRLQLGSLRRRFLLPFEREIVPDIFHLEILQDPAVCRGRSLWVLHFAPPLPLPLLLRLPLTRSSQWADYCWVEGQLSQQYSPL